MAALANRERSIVQAVCQGMANKEIAKELGISVPTAKKHVSSVLAKLGVESRTC